MPEACNTCLLAEDWGMFGDTSDTFAPFSTPPLSVSSPGTIPMAPDRFPTHPTLPHHLALRHPVAAAPLAGQEEVTIVSSLPSLAPSGAQDSPAGVPAPSLLILLC